MLFAYRERRLSVDWNHIKAEYIASEISYRKLADKYGIERNKLQKRATRENWVELRSRSRAKTDARIVESISKQEAHRANNLVDVADKLIDKIIEMLDKSDMLSTQNIKNLTSALKDLKDIKGVKSEADMREQMARIKNLEKQIEKADNTAAITVTFDAGPEEWNE